MHSQVRDLWIMGKTTFEIACELEVDLERVNDVVEDLECGYLEDSNEG